MCVFYVLFQVLLQWLVTSICAAALSLLGLHRDISEWHALELIQNVGIFDVRLEAHTGVVVVDLLGSKDSMNNGHNLVREGSL